MARGTDVTDMKRTYRTVASDEFPTDFSLGLIRLAGLRYGENPNQPAAVYIFGSKRVHDSINIEHVKTGKGGLSATNYMDVTRALNILKFFKKPSVAVMKHLVPSGFATQFENNSLDEIYTYARNADARSAFGSAVVLNRPLDKATAEAIMSTYVEVVAAPEFEEGSIGELERKKDIRAVKFPNLDKIPKFTGDDTEGTYDIKVLPTGHVIVQEPYLSSIRGPEDLITDPLVRKDDSEYVVERDPSAQELEDMLTSWYVNIGTRSNGIVFVKDGVTVAVSSGQQERVGAIEQGITKAYQKALDRKEMREYPKTFEWTMGGLGWETMEELLGYNPLEDAVVSSDAFFPFRDSIDTLAEEDITAVIQPGGSVRDHEVIQAINEHKMAMAYTQERCFGHF